MSPNEIIRQQRERLGLTQDEVAEKTGMSRKGYWNIEAGVWTGTYPSLFAIAQVLDLPVEHITAGVSRQNWWPTEAAQDSYYWPAPGLNLAPPVPFDNATAANAEDTLFAKALACLVLDR